MNVVDVCIVPCVSKPYLRYYSSRHAHVVRAVRLTSMDTPSFGIGIVKSILAALCGFMHIDETVRWTFYMNERRITTYILCRSDQVLTSPKGSYCMC